MIHSSKQNPRVKENLKSNGYNTVDINHDSNRRIHNALVLYQIQCFIIHVQTDFIILGTANITNGTSTVIINNLVCDVTYSIITGGLLAGDLVGPRSSHGTIISGPCPVVVIPATTLFSM